MKSSSDSECKLKEDGRPQLRCLERSKCPSYFFPVCGSNGKTYNNKCLLKVAACEDKKADVEVAVEGQCRFGMRSAWLWTIVVAVIRSDLGGVCSEGKPAAPNGVTCRAFLYRYWYNAASAKCERYVFGGCFEGRNNFYTVEDCQQTCIESELCNSTVYLYGSVHARNCMR